MDTNQNHFLTGQAQGVTAQEKIDWIKSLQIRHMKFPPKMDNFYIDLGLFLIYFKRYKPGIRLALVDCEFLGLVEMDPVEMGVTLLAKFDLPELTQPIVAKGYLLTEIFGDELYNVLPGKGESINLEIEIPKTNVSQISSNEYSLTTMRGKYKEEFLPLRITRFLPS